jgi:hypothetical protein
MNMTIWIGVILGIICLTMPAYAVELVPVPDAGIFWLLGPALIFLGVLGNKKK